MLSDNLIAVANRLINKYGSRGKIDHQDQTVDPITGESTGVSSETVINYTTKPIEAHERIEAPILNGDQIITIKNAFKPSLKMLFIDKDNTRWSIVAITPTDAQNKDIIYDVHVRHVV